MTAPRPHLLVHEHVDDGVDDGAGLGQDRGHDASLGCHQTRRSERSQQCHDAIREPAEQVTYHHSQDHEEDTMLPLSAGGRLQAAHLRDQTGEEYCGNCKTESSVHHIQW